MENKKIYKPKACKYCPVAKIKKDTIECGVVRNSASEKDNIKSEYNMWKNCPLD